MSSILLKNIEIAGGEFQGTRDIVIEKGMLREILAPSTAPTREDQEQFDCANMVALAAPIDNHVHFREPGAGAYKEGWETGSLAALRGGITGVIEVQNSPPYLDCVRAFMEKLILVRKKSSVDYSFYASVTNDNIEQLPELVQYCAGFKLFMGQSTGKLGVDDPQKWLQIARIAAETQTTLVVHAEDESIMERAAQANPGSQCNNRLRPPEAEVKALENAIRVASETGCKLHCFHVSCVKGLELILNAKERGIDVSSGVCPHHLIYTQDDASANPSRLKVFPPLRSKYDRDGLREHLAAGNIDVLQSDHAPHLSSEKDQPFAQTPGGFPGVQCLIPNALTFIEQGILTYNQLDKMLCSNPRRVNNLSSYSIRQGVVAHFTVVRKESGKEYKKTDIFSRCGWSPYEGFPLSYRVAHVFLGGSHTIKLGEPHNPPLPLALKLSKTDRRNVDNS